MEHEVKTPKAVSERKRESARGGGITHTTSHLPFPLCLTHSLATALLRLAQFADHILSSIINACPFVCLFVCLCCTVDNTAQWAIATTCPAVLLRRSATTQTTREQSVRGRGGGGGRAAVRLGQWDENEHWWLSRCTGMGIGQSHTHTHTQAHVRYACLCCGLLLL